MLFKRLSRKGLCFLLTAILALSMIISLVGCGENGVECKYSNEEVIVEVANAFERRGSYIQYNQTLSRRHINPSPEDATIQNRIYLDCSSFVNAVYFEAFGVNVLPYDTSEKSPTTKNYRDYSRDNKDAIDVVGYWLKSEYTTEEAQVALLSEMRSMLKVGDVLNYRKGSTGSSGHALLYIGDDKFIHCAGNDYNFNDDAILSYDGEEHVAVSFLDADALFSDKSSSRYLFGNQFDFCIIRPLSRDLKPTEKTCYRMESYGVEIEKTVSVGVNSGVSKGENITYTVELQNVLAEPCTVRFEETLDENVVFVSSDNDEISLKGKTLKGNVELEGGETLKIKWTVKVSEDANAGALIESNATRVNGMKLNDTVNTVSGYSSAQLSEIAEKAKSYAKTGESFEDPILMAKKLYNDVFGKEIFNYSTVGELLSDAIDIEGLALNEDSSVYGMVAPYLYGGRDVASLYLKSNQIARLVTKANISVGDVIVASDADGEKTIVYVYVGSDQFIYVKSEDSIASSKYMLQSPGSSPNILVTLFAYDTYVILRPSMMAQ